MGIMFACYIKDDIHYKIYGSYEELKEFDNLEHCPDYDDAFTMYAKEFKDFLIGKEYGVSNGDYNFRIRTANINKVLSFLNSIAEIFGDAEFHITDNFHRCRDKFPSILEILCELKGNDVYICDIWVKSHEYYSSAMYKGNDTFFLRIPINYIDGINIKRDVKNWFESEGFTRIENIIEQKLKMCL